jgi:Asp-tRNA(Asn)/Glu-tRNA(Gln) amidotransferase A subunit family amidase
VDAPWLGDACSLVEAFRRGERSPVEELEASLAAIAASDLNAFSHLDPERATDAARRADVSRPFGGVPIGVKELDSVAGWPDTEASLVFRDRVATSTSPFVRRLTGGGEGDGGAVAVGLTTASEFGGLNVGVTRLNGVTHNPWRPGRTPGGSSSGSAAAVAGGLVSLATGGDGGGSIRIPAGYTGLLGMKGTFGRIPRHVAYSRPNTVVLGCLSRSVRDVARTFDVCAGYDPLDPQSIPNPGSWEARLGSYDLAGCRVAIVPSLGGVTLQEGVEARIRETAEVLVDATGMKVVDLDIDLPNLAAIWMVGNMSTLLADLGDRWPGCAGELTDEIVIGLRMSQALYNLRTAADAETLRVRAFRALADTFAEVDFVVAATNPGPAFAADAAMSNPNDSFVDWAKANGFARVATRALLGAVRGAAAALPRLPGELLERAGRRFPDLVQMGGLTMVSNLYGNPAVSVPAGLVDGLPVGLQVLARHHEDPLLLDVALAVERTQGWPLVAPGAPR